MTFWCSLVFKIGKHPLVHLEWIYFLILFLYKTQFSSVCRCIRLVLSELVRGLATPGILCPVLVPAMKKDVDSLGEGPEKVHKDDQRTGSCYREKD